MNNKIKGHNQLSSRPSAANGEREKSGIKASALAAAKAVHHQQIALIVKQTLTTSVIEPCLSPLLWSKSFRLRLDGLQISQAYLCHADAYRITNFAKKI